MAAEAHLKKCNVPGYWSACSSCWKIQFFGSFLPSGTYWPQMLFRNQQCEGGSDDWYCVACLPTPCLLHDCMIVETQAMEKSMKLLQLLPGDTMLKKTTFATVVASGLTIAAANDLYIVNHETLYLAAFVALLRALYIKVGPLVDEFCTQGVNDMKEMWLKFCGKEKSTYEKAIESLKEQRQYKQFVDDYLQVAQENIELESKLHEILQMNKNAQAIKAKLDERARQISEERENERKRILMSLMDKVMADIKDPRTQAEIMKQCLADIESIGVRKLAL